jgi:NAD(P)-dependent dehydrogenase (short-subunit alcohol dehydrogenase family)
MSDQDPRTAGPQPDFPEQPQELSGSTEAMEPRPDHGEDSYRGFGRLEGKVALVTGADSGIGRAVALAFAREGADVALSYLDEDEDAREAARLVEEAGRRALLLPGDIGSAEHCRECVARTAAELGGLHVLVNNAAYQVTMPIAEVDEGRLERHFRTNIMSMFFFVQAALDHLQPGASIINVASIQAYQPSPELISYATTKGAIVTFTKGLAQELTPERGIRVNAIAPGPVWTPLIPATLPPEQVSEFGAESPMARPAQPAELAPAFVFLASDESRFVSAEVLGVTGGMPLA